MDLQNTKATEQNCTGSRFKNLVLHLGIVKLSPELKSSAVGKTSENNRHVQNQTSGLRSEKLVIEQLQKMGWTVLFHRGKTSIAEIDLILEKGNQIRLVEVKTLDDRWRSFQRISRRQIQKLLINQIHFSNIDDEFFVSSWIAWVSKTGIEYSKIN